MKILLFRSAAFGDLVCITPVIRHLKSLGHELYVVTSKRGEQVLRNNPNIHKLLMHDEDIKINQLSDHIDWLQHKNHCEKIVDFSESIEVSLSQHPRGPDYKLPKDERFKRFNINFYEHAFKWASEKMDGMELRPTSYKPELFFEPKEIDEALSHLKRDTFNLLLGMSGSGHNKCWPWSSMLAEQIVSEYPDVHIITVGDERCQGIEPIIEGRVTNLSGKVPMRISMAMTGLVNCVISPDTGLLHASGCYPTPKIGILGHNTIECITKHFENDYSVESNPKLAECSPCFFLIYDMKMQCPIDNVTHGNFCMSRGIPQEVVMEKFRQVYAEHKKRSG